MIALTPAFRSVALWLLNRLLVVLFDSRVIALAESKVRYFLLNNVLSGEDKRLMVISAAQEQMEALTSGTQTLNADFAEVLVRLLYLKITGKSVTEAVTQPQAPTGST